mmetsp:Transcript_93569/g.209517  ORF Transcript_93569/g.209517 Transcript_93569/m.209517 type:complete len:452 (-) Transcript_93569:1345-2700(-)
MAPVAVSLGLPHDAAVPVALPVRVVPAIGPRGPLAHEAMDGQARRMCALLRLLQGAGRWDTALVVLDLNAARSPREPNARARGPLAPHGELAILPHTRQVARLVVLALLRLKLRTGAVRVLGALEERDTLRKALDAERTIPHRGLDPAASVATTGGRPRVPSAEERLLALAGAVGHLLGMHDVTLLAAVVRHLRDGAVALFLASALHALTPLAPLAPLAVRARLDRPTTLGIAGCHDLERLGEGRPTMRSVDLQEARLRLLASTALTVAFAPLAPLAQLGVLHSLRRARPLWKRPGLGVAGHDLVERGLRASQPVAPGVILDGAGAVLDAIALLAALGPLRPTRQLAVEGNHAGWQVLADLVLLPQAAQCPAALVGILLDVPAAAAETTAARGRARGPVVPLAPRSVPAVMLASIRVARDCFLHGLVIAERAAVPGRDGHQAVAALHTSTA